MDKKDINIRFIEAVNYIVSRGLASNKAEVAKTLDISAPKLSEILNYRMNIGTDIAALLCSIYPISTSWLLTGQGEMLRTATDKDKPSNSIPMYEDVASIGGVNTISASLDGVMPSSKYIDAGDWFKGASAAIRHYGDSMREYPSGSIIVIKEVMDMSQIVWGRNYCIETDDFRITKKLQRGSSSSSITAYSTNTDTYPDGHLIHEPLTIDLNKIRRLFLVMGCVIKEQSSGPIYIEDSLNSL